MSRLYLLDEIHVDENGKPYPRPEREDFPDTIDGLVDWWRAVSEYRQGIANRHNEAFAKSFSAALRKKKGA